MEKKDIDDDEFGDMTNMRASNSNINNMSKQFEKLAAEKKAKLAKEAAANKKPVTTLKAPEPKPVAKAVSPRLQSAKEKPSTAPAGGNMFLNKIKEQKAEPAKIQPASTAPAGGNMFLNKIKEQKGAGADPAKAKAE